jgi:D-alanyl-D-alanine-carboxypeptidase/D-alanyl-D-alanine-endopeptidase
VNLTRSRIPLLRSIGFLVPLTILALILNVLSAPRAEGALPPVGQNAGMSGHSLAQQDTAELSWKTLKGEVRPFEQIREAIRGIMADSGLKGVSIALVQRVLRKGSQTYFIQLGVEDPITQKPIDGTTVFATDILGQPLIGYMIMKLVTARKFDIDRPLHQYLPKPLAEYPEYWDLAGDPRHKRLTARLILSHQSGLPNSRLDDPDHRLRFVMPPGKRFGYSEESFAFLRFTLERMFGWSFNDLARLIAFDRLSMRNSSFVREAQFEKHPPGASREKNDLTIEPGEKAIFITNASDYSQFMSAVMLVKGTLDFSTCSSYYVPEITIRSEKIFEPPGSDDQPANPRRLAWCLGWGTYETPKSRAYFIGRRNKGFDCYATAFDYPYSTAVAIFTVGDSQGSAVARILRELIGDVETPLVWLGFEP